MYHWFTCTPDRWHNRACRVFTSVASQQEHPTARNSSIPRKSRFVDINSEAGMTLDDSMGEATLAQSSRVVPASDCVSTGRRVLGIEAFLAARCPRSGATRINTRHA